MPVTCASCGKENTDDARFCSGCGQSLSLSAEAPVASASAAATSEESAAPAVPPPSPPSGMAQPRNVPTAAAASRRTPISTLVVASIFLAVLLWALAITFGVIQVLALVLLAGMAIFAIRKNSRLAQVFGGLFLACEFVIALQNENHNSIGIQVLGLIGFGLLSLAIAARWRAQWRWAMAAGCVVALALYFNMREAQTAALHQQQVAAQRSAEQQAAAARALAHERRVAWQLAHPAEYARQRAAARAAALRRTAEMQREAAEAHAQAAAEAASERRQARIPMYRYWDAAKGALDDAVASSHAGASALGDEDLVTASADFSDCANKASTALEVAGNNVPDGWQDVSDALGVAASKLEDACNTAVSALDDEKPSEVAAALSEIRDFNAAETIAVIKAEELWLGAGGNPNDL